MAEQPKFSIVTPSFNQGKYIRDTIDSVLRQGYSNFEHIVIDGGSTDETISILKSYSHLQWISEPDDGQSDALNKALARADGDIIGWLNSDDWYADNIFDDVAKALEQYPIVLGYCELRDRDNNKMYRVENNPSTWFDMLKYWVPYSIPTQPSIFMRREVLEAAKRPDGSYVDTGLNYCMDYDLWMRISQSYPFTHCLGKVLAYYRMTGENKTGQSSSAMPYAEPEMSRVYNRYKDSPLTIEHQIGFVVPTDTAHQISTTLESLASQSLPSGEVVCVNFSGDQTLGSEIGKLCAEFNARAIKKGSNFYFRYINSKSASYVAALNEGINATCASLIAYIDPSLTADSSLINEILSLFSADRVGLGLPLKSDYASYIEAKGSDNQITIPKLLGVSQLPRAIVARKIGLVEIDGFDESLSLNSALCKVIRAFDSTGWSVSIENNLRIVERRE